MGPRFLQLIHSILHFILSPWLCRDWCLCFPVSAWVNELKLGSLRACKWVKSMDLSGCLFWAVTGGGNAPSGLKSPGDYGLVILSFCIVASLPIYRANDTLTLWRLLWRSLAVNGFSKTLIATEQYTAQKTLGSCLELSAPFATQYSWRNIPFLTALGVCCSFLSPLCDIYCFPFVWTAPGPGSCTPPGWFPKKPWTIAGLAPEHSIAFNLHSSIKEYQGEGNAPLSRHDFSPGGTWGAVHSNCKGRGSYRPWGSGEEKILKGVRGKAVEKVFKTTWTAPWQDM